MQEANLVQALSRLSRDDLDRDGLALPAPELASDLARLQFVRLARLGRFWTLSERRQPVVGHLERNAQGLIGSIGSSSSAWMTLIRGTPSRVEYWVGSSVPTDAIRGLLRAAYLDVQIGSDALDRSCLGRMRHRLQITGVPSRRAEGGNEPGSTAIDKLCRALYGCCWLYVVRAAPVSRRQVIDCRNQLLQDICAIQANYLLKGSPMGDQNRVAQRCVQLLEAELKRYEQGQHIGMWTTQIVLGAEDLNWLQRGRAVLLGAFPGEATAPEPIRASTCRPDVGHGGYQQVLTSAEAALLAHPPAEEFPGYEVVDVVRFGVQPLASGATGEMVRIGDIMDRGAATGNDLSVPIRDLTKHALIVGVTGSGKTNTCMRLLEQIWDCGRGVPFLVIESAKSEYRSLLNEGPFRGLKVFTVGDETTFPLRLNPFEVPPGILVQTHIDYLKSLFAAAFVLYPPMPYVLEQALREVYTDRGWNLVRNVNSRGTDSARVFPTLSDLVAKVRTVVDRLGYDERITMDVKAGLVARLDQLRSGGGKGPMLDTRASIPSTVLFGSPVIVELKHLVDDDEKAFIIGLILIRLYEHHERLGYLNPAGVGLRHVTLIEEAHRLLRNVCTEQGSEVVANPKGRAIEVFANILSEIRAFGEGLLIAEQVPVKLVPDALRNTNLKIVHRLVAEDDRKAVAAAMNLDETQTRSLTTLRAGEAVAYAEGMQQPVLVSIPLAAAKHGDRTLRSGAAEAQAGPDPDANETIRRAQGVRAFWHNNPARMPFPACSLCRAKDAGASCATHSADQASPTLRAAFRRLFNTLWLEGQHVQNSYEDFREMCLRLSGPRRDPNLAYCLFAEMVNTEIDRRGAFWGWSHRDVEAVIAAACEIVSVVDREPTELLVQRQAKFASLLFDLHRSADRPYAGCAACRQPCMFRYDMNLPPSTEHVATFRRTYFDPKVKHEAVIQLLNAAVDESYYDVTSAVGRGAALCFTVQQLSDSGLSADQQQGEAHAMAEMFAAGPETPEPAAST
jgi:hypothetical protein